MGDRRVAATAGLMLGTMLSCAALLLVATPALAKQKENRKLENRKLGPVVTETSSVQAAANNTPMTATASCTGKRRAIGGGFTAPSTVTPNAFSIVYRSVREGEQSWSTSAVSFNAFPVTLTTYVYCRKVKGKISDITGTGSTGPEVFAQGAATATCTGKKKKLIAGGFESDRGANPQTVMVPYINMAQGKSWVYSGVNFNPGVRTLVSHAYCTRRVKSAVQVSASQTATLAGTQSLSAASPICPRKKRLSAGGWSAVSPTPTTGMGGPISIPTDNRIVGSNWLTTIYNVGGTAQVTLTAQGICTA